MEEQFILRVPPSVAERIERLLNESSSSSSDDKSLDLSFSAAEQEEEGDENARGGGKKPAATSVAKDDVPETAANAGEPDRSETEDSDGSV